MIELLKDNPFEIAKSNLEIPPLIVSALVECNGDENSVPSIIYGPSLKLLHPKFSMFEVR